MKEKIIYALDFDGVICDSAVETGVTGWKAGLQLWGDYLTPLPSAELIDQFRQIRPKIETGYEAILIIRLLHEGEEVDKILNDYSEKTQYIINKFGLDIDLLKKIFGETRDKWINDDLAGWLQMNPLFSSIAEKLQQLATQGTWYIITTKQERFVKQILMANKVEITDENIFGLDRKMSKQAVLAQLAKKHRQDEIYFVEDRLATLSSVINNPELKAIKLFFALWGYNTEQDKQAAKKGEIESINLEDFLY